MGREHEALFGRSPKNRVAPSRRSVEEIKRLSTSYRSEPLRVPASSLLPAQTSGRSQEQLPCEVLSVLFMRLFLSERQVHSGLSLISPGQLLTLFQRLNEMYARVAARHFGSFQVQLGQFPRPAERFTIRHNLANHSPFVCSARRQRLWVQQESLCSSCSSAITPGSKNSIAWHNASGEVRNIVEGRTLGCHNHTGK